MDEVDQDFLYMPFDVVSVLLKLVVIEMLQTIKISNIFRRCLGVRYVTFSSLKHRIFASDH